MMTVKDAIPTLLHPPTKYKRKAMHVNQDDHRNNIIIKRIRGTCVS